MKFPVKIIPASFSCILLCLGAAALALEPTIRVFRVGVVGSSAILPCQLPSLPDSPNLVLWYRNTNTKPFYSYDGRPSNTEGSHKIHDKSGLRDRVKFIPKRGFHHKGAVGNLRIDDVKLTDAGNYTCRVDFPQAQTRMSMLTMEVYEPIKKLNIEDKYGVQVNDIAGPYAEGSDLEIKCSAIGGHPETIVEWYSLQNNGTTSLNSIYRQPSNSIDDVHDNDATRIISRSKFSTSSRGRHTKEAILTIDKLQAPDHGRKFVCKATQSNLMAPISKEIYLDVYFGPESVSLKGVTIPLKADEKIHVECEVVNSRPPAIIKWSPAELFANAPNISPRENVVRVLVQPTWLDDGKPVSCSATNPKMTSRTVTATATLQVQFPPHVKAHLAPTIDQGNIKEKDDVYFECEAVANPPPKSIKWIHNNETHLRPGNWAGGLVMIHGDNLVLQQLTRAAEGEYRCKVESDLGVAISKPAVVRVMYAPECESEEPKVISSLPDEKTTLNCAVNSPIEETKFMWSVNTSRGVAVLDESLYTISGSQSQLSFTPKDHEPLLLQDHHDIRHKSNRYQNLKTPQGEEIFGIVYCTASNKFGSQKKPCTFVIKPTGPPDELESCTLVNQSANSLSVSCVPGRDGGLGLNYTLKVFDESTGIQIANTTSVEPNLMIGNLTSGKDYMLQIRAVNSKGESAPYLLQGFALKVAENKIHAPSPESPTAHLLPVFVGSITGVVVMVLLLLLLTKIRQISKRNRERALPVIKNEESCSSPESDFVNLRPLKEVSHRGTLTDNLDKACEGENYGFEGFLRSDSCNSLSGRKIHHGTTCNKHYDIIYDGERKRKPLPGKSQSMSCEFLNQEFVHFDQSSKFLGVECTESSAQSTLFSKFGLNQPSTDSIISNLSEKSITSRNFPFSSLRRLPKSHFTSRGSHTLRASKVKDKDQVPKSNPNSATHIQLVNCDGKDEVILDSDNLNINKKFQCTRRRDESFV